MPEHVRASRRKHHIIYKTTCLVTGRYYIGMHSTDDLNDSYLGSGLRLSRSIKKYGKDKHIREILENLSTRAAASAREKELITEEVRADPLCLNCGPGGLGATDKSAHPDEVKRKISAASKDHWQKPGFKEQTGAAISSALKKNWAAMDDDQKREQTEHLRKALAKRVAQDPLLKEQMRARGKSTSEKLWADPAHREKMSQKMKARHANPEYREAQRAKTEAKRLLREQDPVYQAERARKRREQADRLNTKRRLERSQKK